MPLLRTHHDQEQRNRGREGSGEAGEIHKDRHLPLREFSGHLYPRKRDQYAGEQAFLQVFGQPRFATEERFRLKASFLLRFFLRIFLCFQLCLRFFLRMRVRLRVFRQSGMLGQGILLGADPQGKGESGE